MSTPFYEIEWKGVWPDEAEPGLLAALLSDLHPTDSDSRISGLEHAYLSVAANEGLGFFSLLLLCGTSLTGLSAWLFVHIIQTENLLFTAALLPSLLLVFYCLGYIALGYRMRMLLYEAVLSIVLMTLTLWQKLGQALSSPSNPVADSEDRQPSVASGHTHDVTNEKAFVPNQELCHKCSLVASDSHLIRTRKSNGFLARFLDKNTETWPHWPLHTLHQSAQKCPLCKLLLGATEDKETQASATESALPTLKLWEDRGLIGSSKGVPQVRMKLQGAVDRGPTLIVKEGLIESKLASSTKKQSYR